MGLNIAINIIISIIVGIFVGLILSFIGYMTYGRAWYDYEINKVVVKPAIVAMVLWFILNL